MTSSEQAQGCGNCRAFGLWLGPSFLANAQASNHSSCHFPPPILPLTMMPPSHQTFRPVPTVKLLGIMFKIRCWAITFSHDYNRRCRRMVSKLVGVISPATSTKCCWARRFISWRPQGNAKGKEKSSCNCSLIQVESICNNLHVCFYP